MTDIEAIDQRLSAVERALTDSDDEFEALADADDIVERLATVEERLDDLEAQLTELDATAQALRGYVGNVRSVNQAVERRAETALAKVETLETDRADGASATDEPRAGTDSTRSTVPTESDTEQPTGSTDDSTAASAHDATHRCAACGRTTDERQQGSDAVTSRAGEETPTEWARAVGEGQTSTADETARTDGGNGRQRGSTRRQQSRDRHTDQSAVGSTGSDDGGVLAGLRDVL